MQENLLSFGENKRKEIFAEINTDKFLQETKKSPRQCYEKMKQELLKKDVDLTEDSFLDLEYIVRAIYLTKQSPYRFLLKAVHNQKRVHYLIKHMKATELLERRERIDG